jgi:colanic acid/amylovoran biosynthesis glycosyltransferase
MAVVPHTPPRHGETRSQGDERERASLGRDRPVAWLMSRFPAISETFILQEIVAAARAGTAVRIYPLVRQHETTVHPEVAALADRVHDASLGSPATLAAQLHWLRRRPRRYLGAWWTAIAGTARSPRFLARALVVVPLAARFAREMEAEGVRHQHAHWATHPALAALVVRRLTGIPYTFTAHAHDIYVNRTMLDRKIREAQMVVTISDFNRRLLEREYGELVAGRIAVVRCGIDLSRFPERGGPPPEDTPFRVLCVAGLRDYKGHEHLIRAVALMNRAGRAVALELIGSGPLERELRDFAEREGVAGAVDFRGALPGDRVAEAMERCHVVAMPSVVAADGRMEGLPVALMEAMARGVPVVASDLSAIPELVESEVTGILVPPADGRRLADALARLMDDPALAACLARAGASRARARHDIVANTGRLLALIDSGRAPGAPGELA